MCEPSHSGRTLRGGRALVLSAAGALALLAAGGEIDAAQAALPQQAGRADLVSDVQLRIDGAIGGGRTSAAVAGAGDVNGDGRGDVVVGAPQETARGRSGSGSAYVIFGTESPTRVDLAQVGARGFRIDGAADGDRLGTAVGGAGDVNGDGLADVVLGAPEADAHGRGGSGSAFVVFGRRETSAAVDLAALGGAGFRIDGAAALDNAGAAVAGAGDVNGDGRADLVVGAPQAGNNARPGSGSAHVVFGRRETSEIDLAALGGAGFRIDGAAALDNAGAAVAGAGDVNGDGRADLVVGAPQAGNNARTGSGSAHVVFGRRETSEIDLATLGGAGFRIDGAAALDNAGAAVAGAGDVNGDGRADVVVGAPQAGNNARPGSGSAHVLIGFGTPRVAYGELVAAAGVAMAPLTPTVERTGPATFAVSPALPEGLSLDAATGVISGTPTTARPRRAHTVTMTDLAGTAQSALVITVRGRRPGGVCGVVPRRERPSFTPGTVTLSARQLRINQRIAQAAVRRVNAVQAWLDARVDGGDICGLSLTAAKFGPGIVIGAGPTAPASDAFPRPFREKRPPRSREARVVLSAGQLRVSQRISQAAMRRAKALSRRLDRGLTGGDIRRGTITRDVLAPGLAIVAATPAPNPPRPSRTVIRAPRARKPARFELSAAQLLTNQRIAQAALRRATVLRDELRAGLTAEDFRDRTITAVNLAPALIPSAGARQAVP